MKRTILSVMAAVLVGTSALGSLSHGVKTRAEELPQSDFTVVTDMEGVFQGIDLKESPEGALYIGAKADATLSDSFLYAVTEFQLGTNTIYDYDNGGIMLNLSTLGNTKQFNTRIYVFANDVSGTTFFARGGAEASGKYPIINDGEEVGELNAVSSRSIARVPANVNGTVCIPWTSMTQSGNTSDPTTMASAKFENSTNWRVAIHTSLTTTSATVACPGEGLGIRSISSYAKQDDGTYKVVKGFDSNAVTYTYTGSEVENANVNVADVTAGKTVSNTKMHDTGLSIKNYKKDTNGTTSGSIEYGRVVKETFVDESNASIKEAGYKVVKNISYADGVWSADGIAAPAVDNYSVKSSLLNVTEGTLTHTYKASSALDSLTADNFFMRGASIRIGVSEKGDGIRFGVAMEKEVYESLKESATFGMLLIPTDLAGEKLSLTTANVANVSGNELTWTEYTENGKTYVTAIVCLWGIPEASYAREISAVAYAQAGEEVKYTTEIKRSIQSVAQDAYESASEEVKELLNKYLPA